MKDAPTVTEPIPSPAPLAGPRALVADDQADVLEALRLLLKSEGYQIETASSPAGVLDALRQRSFDLLLMDLNYARDTTSGREGLDLVNSVRALDQTLPIVVMTAWGTVDLAVETMQRGVGDFVTKPWENNRLIDILRAQVGKGRERREAERLEAEKQKLRRREEQEFAEAREIQQALMPTTIPQFPGFQISGAWQPARAVGGDYFDVIPVDERRAAICIADVVGKGMPAALLMSNLQAAVKAFGGARSQVPMKPDDLCDRVNRMICHNSAVGKFITFFYGVLDTATRSLAYCNAGHNPPIVVRRNGDCTHLRVGGGALGISPDWTYEAGEFALLPGDRVALYTDGITEAIDADGEEFGEARLVALLAEHRTRGAEELQQRILRAVTEFNHGDLPDDATLLVLAVE